MQDLKQLWRENSEILKKTNQQYTAKNQIMHRFTKSVDGSNTEAQ